MITELTKEQERLIPVYRQKWSDQFFKGSFNEKLAFEFVDWLYDLVGEKPPVKIVLDSPLSVQLAINVLKSVGDEKNLGSKLYSKLHSKLHSKLNSEIYSKLGSKLDSELFSKLDSELNSKLNSEIYSKLDSKLDSELYSKLHSKLNSKLDSKLDSELSSKLDSELFSKLDSELRQYANKKFEYHAFDFRSDTSWFGYLAFYDYINHVLFPKVKIPIFEKYLKYNKANINFLVTFEGIAFLSKQPTFITFDENNKLHNTTRAAVEYADGYKEYFINGTHFPEKLFQQLTTGKITAQQVITHKNLEQKACMIKHIGYEQIIKSLGNKAKLLDQQNGQVHGGEVSYELYDIQLQKDIKHRVIKVMWYDKHGSLDTTFIGVPRQDSTKTCKGALAWCNPLLKPEEVDRYEEIYST